jgi:hypothetical protein
MDVVVSEEARTFVRRLGGTVFVDPHTHRCCAGAMTILSTATDEPGDADEFTSLGVDGIDVQFRRGPEGLPHQLTIELRGVLRRRLVASWDGCAYRM